MTSPDPIRTAVEKAAEAIRQRCACIRDEAKDCYQARHNPRMSDMDDDDPDDGECECFCHEALAELYGDDQSA